MVIGIHSRQNDLTVNPLKAKQLTNIRAAGSDENIILVPPIQTTLDPRAPCPGVGPWSERSAVLLYRLTVTIRLAL